MAKTRLDSACEVRQQMPPQNMSSWHKDSFELKAIEKQQIQEMLSVLPAICLKMDINL